MHQSGTPAARGFPAGAGQALRACTSALGGQCSSRSLAAPLNSCRKFRVVLQVPARQSPRSQTGPGAPPAQQQQLLTLPPVTFLKRPGSSWQSMRL